VTHEPDVCDLLRGSTGRRLTDAEWGREQDEPTSVEPVKLWRDPAVPPQWEKPHPRKKRKGKKP